MRTYSYPALFEPGGESGIVVSFPDVPEAITQGTDLADAQAMASDALGLALLSYFIVGQTLPSPSRPKDGHRLMTASPELSAKIAALEAFRDAGVTKSELGRRLGKDEREIRRILDPNHATKLSTLKKALAALGRRLVVGVEAARSCRYRTAKAESGRHRRARPDYSRETGASSEAADLTAAQVWPAGLAAGFWSGCRRGPFLPSPARP